MALTSWPMCPSLGGDGAVVRPSAETLIAANFALKLSENPHERANLLAIRRLIAT